MLAHEPSDLAPTHPQRTKHKTADIEAMVAKAVATFGPIDTLVNNAAVFDFKALPDIDEAHFHYIFNTNVLGLLTTTKVEAANFNAAGGSVINRAKLVKTPDELSCMRTALHLAAIGIAAVQAQLAPGVRQTDLTATFLRTIFDHGADANILEPRFAHKSGR